MFQLDLSIRSLVTLVCLEMLTEMTLILFPFPLQYGFRPLSIKIKCLFSHLLNWPGFVACSRSHRMSVPSKGFTSTHSRDLVYKTTGDCRQTQSQAQLRLEESFSCSGNWNLQIIVLIILSH
jgi:hypothetical protein